MIIVVVLALERSSYEANMASSAVAMVTDSRVTLAESWRRNMPWSSG